MENHKSSTGWLSDPEVNQDPDNRYSFRDEAVRRGWEERLRVVRGHLQGADPSVSAGRLLETLRAFERDIFEEQRSLLATALLWTEPEQVAAQWVQGAYRDLAQAAADAFCRAAGPPGSGYGATTGHLAALALAAFGAATKWAEIADTPHEATRLAEVKRVYSVIDAGGNPDAPFAVPHGEAETALSLRALFLRTLLLDAICRGNLGPRQIEIVDSWLWEWCGDYVLTDRAEGAVLALDRHGMRGLRTVEAGAAHRGQRFVNIEALAGHIARVARHFRDGHIYPGYGCAAEFRVEEHVAALDFLRRFLDSARGRGGREPRRVRAGRLEAFIGLTEVASKGFAARPAQALPTPDPGSAPPHAAIDSRFDIPRRYVRLLDESLRGLGVTCEDHAARSVDVGTLLGLLDTDGPPPLVAEVVRRSAPEGPADVAQRLGLRVISHSPRRLTLEVVDTGGKVEAIYVPGEDKGGYQDALIVSQADFERPGLLKAALADRIFTLRFNRVRYHGNGWYLAGFAVVEERPSGARAEDAR